MTLDASGRLGIGTASPGSPLVVQSASANPLIVANATGTQDGAIQLLRSGSLIGALYINNSGEFFIRQHTANNLIFQTNGTERARIDSSGTFRILGAGSSGSPAVSFNGSAASNSMVLDANGFTGLNCTPSVERLRVRGGNASSTQFGLFVENSTPNTTFTVRNDGQLTAPQLGSGAGTNTLKWNSTGGVITYDTSSARYKDNIRNSKYGLEAIIALKSRMFEYKDDGRTDVGLIAEEVIDVIPELVSLNKDNEPDSVSYDRFVSVLVAGIQELAAKVTALEEQLNG
jgi:hypothetical protein